MEKLNLFEKRMITALLKAHELGIADLSEPFRARECAGYILSVPVQDPTGQPRVRSPDKIPNVYKMNYLLKKSKMFDRFDMGANRGNEWILKPEYM